MEGNELDKQWFSGLAGRGNVYPDEAIKLKELYEKYVPNHRGSVLNTTCSSCIREMFQELQKYL